MNKHTLTPVAAIIGTLATSAISLSVSANTDINPFAMQQLASGYMLLAEGKCGEGKCGADKASKTEGKCGADKAAKAEGKCGEDKAAKAEGKCGEDKAAKAEGKCGEGKCGGSK